MEDYEAAINEENFEKHVTSFSTTLVPEVVDYYKIIEVKIQSVEENIIENITTVEEEVSEKDFRSYEETVASNSSWEAAYLK